MDHTPDEESKVRIAHGWLVKRIRKKLLNLTQKELASGASVDPKTIISIEKFESVSDNTIKSVTDYLVRSLKEAYSTDRNAKHFDASKHPKLAWLIRRLKTEAEHLLHHHEVHLNHENRYLFDSYEIHLSVWPCPTRTIQIGELGEEPETFTFSNLAFLERTLHFSEENQRKVTGYEFYYETTGKLKATAPEAVSYRQKKGFVSYRPDPKKGVVHKLNTIILGGYGQGHEIVHFKMTQEAIYRHIGFTLDLSGYPSKAISSKPTLLLVAVPTDRDFDCCSVAGRKLGLPLNPELDSPGSKWRWKIRGDVRDVMICIHWTIDDKVLQANMPEPSDQLRRMFDQLTW